MKKRRLSFALLVLGILLWLGGGMVIFFSEVLAVQILGIALFAVGPVLVFVAGRMLRPRR